MDDQNLSLESQMNPRFRDINYTLLRSFLHSTDVTGGASPSLENSRSEDTNLHAASITSTLTFTRENIHPRQRTLHALGGPVTSGRIKRFVRTASISLFPSCHGVRDKDIT